jgi:hypothetical protein
MKPPRSTWTTRGEKGKAMPAAEAKRTAQRRIKTVRIKYLPRNRMALFNELFMSALIKISCGLVYLPSDFIIKEFSRDIHVRGEVLTCIHNFFIGQLYY